MGISKKAFANYIKKQRIEAGLTQEELAERLHVSGKAVSKWECGQRLPDIDMVDDLATALGVSVQEIYDNSRKQDFRHLINPNMIAIIAVMVVGVIATVVIWNSRRPASLTSEETTVQETEEATEKETEEATEKETGTEEATTKDSAEDAGDYKTVPFENTAEIVGHGYRICLDGDLQGRIIYYKNNPSFFYMTYGEYEDISFSYETYSWDKYQQTKDTEQWGEWRISMVDGVLEEFIDGDVGKSIYLCDERIPMGQLEFMTGEIVYRKFYCVAFGCTKKDPGSIIVLEFPYEMPREQVDEVLDMIRIEIVEE